MSFPVPIPIGLRERLADRPAADGPSGADWLATLPRLLGSAAARWSLTDPEPARYGECALVVPCRAPEGPVALKLTWPHPEARFEHLALRAWAGQGAVRLVAADVAQQALLLERLDPDRDLNGVDLLEACEILGGLLRRLDRPTLPQLGDFPLAQWQAVCAAGQPSVPRRMSQQAASWLHDLAPGARLVHNDLHFGNVLAAGREPWLAIDPKPVTAAPSFAVAPALWNRWPEAAAAHNLRAHLRLRAGVLAEAAGLDEDEVLAWSFVRCVLHALGATADHPLLSRWITIAKAMI